MSGTIEHNGKEYELAFTPCEWVDDPTVVELPGGRLAVGYLVHDDSPSNPLDDCDAMGQVVKFSQRDFLLDGYGSPDIADIADEILAGDDVELVGHDDQDARGAAEKLAVARWEDMVDGLDVVALEHHDYHTDEPYSIACETAADLRELMERGRTPEYQWEPDKYLLKELCEIKDPTARRAKALEYCQQALAEYNKYCSGDCYGVVVEVFDAEGKQEDEDACWGYLGREYAEECLADEIKSLKTKNEKHTETRANVCV